MTCQRMWMVLIALPWPEVQRSKLGSLETLGEDKQGLRLSLSPPASAMKNQRGQEKLTNILWLNRIKGRGFPHLE